MATIGYAALAEITGLSRRTLKRLVRADVIPHRRISARIVRFDREAIAVWWDECKRGPEELDKESK